LSGNKDRSILGLRLRISNDFEAAISDLFRIGSCSRRISPATAQRRKEKLKFLFWFVAAPLREKPS
jgi:hypothetical protein